MPESLLAASKLSAQASASTAWSSIVEGGAFPATGKKPRKFGGFPEVDKLIAGQISAKQMCVDL
jgi:hypothetical protein